MSDEIYDLIWQAEDLPYGPERIALLDQAVREADALNDSVIAYYARMEIVDAAAHGGYHEKSLVAFSWCLAQFDQAPEQFDLYELLWRYKWIVDFIPAFPQVSRAKILEMQDDMEKRYTQYDFSLRPIHYMRLSNAMRMGDLDEAMRHYDQFKDAPRDDLADCPACECDKEVELMARVGNDVHALELAKPLLDGTMTCQEIPHLTYGHIIRPLLRLGRMDEASQQHATGYRLISTNREFLRCVAEHLLYLVRASDFAGAIRLFEKHLPWAIETAELDARFRFYSSSAASLQEFVKRESPNRKLNLPPSLGAMNAEEGADLNMLADYFRQESQKLAEQFNHRNGNDYYSRQLAETLQLSTPNSSS